MYMLVQLAFILKPKYWRQMHKCKRASWWLPVYRTCLHIKGCFSGTWTVCELCVWVYSSCVSETMTHTCISLIDRCSGPKGLEWICLLYWTGFRRLDSLSGSVSVLPNGTTSISILSSPEVLLKWYPAKRFSQKYISNSMASNLLHNTNISHFRVFPQGLKPAVVLQL